MIALTLILLPLGAYAGSYSSEISFVMTSFTLNNYSCKSAPQQEVNGTYRTVKMLEIIAKVLDKQRAVRFKGVAGNHGDR